MDAWDEKAIRVPSQDRRALAALARDFLVERGDHALGLGPASLLPPQAGGLWLLYWCAARRVDDSIEGGETTAQDWKRRLSSPSADTFVERCLETLFHARELDHVDLANCLRASLRGLESEARFTKPRSWAEYEALLELKSVPTMQVFDALLAPDTGKSVRAAHARKFAVSAQLGDDCRDVHRDLARGRCFVTKEELGNNVDLASFVGTREFTEGRVRMCERFLDEAERAAEGFVSEFSRDAAAKLHRFWREALRGGLVRPSDTHLPFVVRG